MAERLTGIDEIATILKAAYKKKVLARFPDGSGVIISYIMHKDEFPYRGMSIAPETLEKVLKKYPEIKLR